MEQPSYLGNKQRRQIVALVNEVNLKCAIPTTKNVIQSPLEQRKPKSSELSGYTSDTNPSHQGKGNSRGTLVWLTPSFPFVI